MGKTYQKSGRFLFVLLLCCLPLALWAEDAEAPADRPAEDNWEVGFDQLDRVFTPGKAVHVENLFGDLRLRPSDNETTTVTAALQGYKNDPVQPEIVAVEKDDRVVIRVRFSDPESGRELTPQETGKRRVDLAVFFGKAGDIEVVSRIGLVEAKSLPGHLKVTSESAHLRLVVKNTLEAHCSYGPVEVFFKKAADYHPPKLSSITGKLQVEFPEHVNALVKATTTGYLASDYSTVIDRPSGARRKNAEILIGKGGEVVTMESKSGDIFVLERPSLVQAGKGADQGEGSKP